MDVSAVTQVIQLGASGILLFLLSQLWKEFQEQNRYIREMLTSLQADNEAIASGLNALADGDMNAVVKLRRQKAVKTGIQAAAALKKSESDGKNG